MRKTVVLLLFLAAPTVGQIRDYSVRQEFFVSAPGWHAIPLTSAIRAKMKSGISDVRIFEIGAADTLEVPYLVRTHYERYQKTEVPMSILNQGIGADGFQALLSPQKPSRINRIELTFQESNYDWRLRLEGSQDQKQWVRLEDGYRILGISNDFIDYQYRSIQFHDADFAFYRLTFIGLSQRPKNFSARIYNDRRKLAVFDTLNAAWSVSSEPKEKRTRLTIQLTDSLPVDRLHVTLFHERDYYRNARVYSLRNSVNTEKGVIDNWDFQGQFVLSSLDSSDLSIATVTTRRIKLEIDNRDDRELTVRDARVLSARTELVADFAVDKRYVLAYGKSGATSPQYDIVYFSEKIPEDVRDVTLGDISSAAEDTKEDGGLLKHRLWVWAAIIVIIVLMGSFSISLLKKAKQPDQPST